MGGSSRLWGLVGVPATWNARIWALAAAAVATVACGSDPGGEGTDPPLIEADGGDGGSPPAPGEDSGADAPALDAGPDVKVDAGPPFCSALSPAPKFCDDFDDGDLSDDWDFTNVILPSTLVLDTATFASAPASMHVQTKTLAAMQNGPAHLRRTIFATAVHPRLSFSAFYASTSITSGAVAIASLDVSLSHFFTLYLRDAPGDGTSDPAVVLEEIDGSATIRHVLPKAPPAGVWTRIGIDVDLVRGRATVSYGGEKVLDDEVVSMNGGEEVTVRVGAVYVFGPAAPFEAVIDDVVVDY